MTLAVFSFPTATPALADGGDGFAPLYPLGGTGGADNPTGPGGDGTDGVDTYGGGGGGAGTTGGSGGNGGLDVNVGGAGGLTAGNPLSRNGVDGDNNTTNGGGGGGGGAHGYVDVGLPGAATTGGNGGNGGDSNAGGNDGGGGGAGGYGAVITGTPTGTISGDIAGGDGGAGGIGDVNGGGGGSGGIGLFFDNAAGATVEINAAVTGGEGGAGGTSDDGPTLNGDDGPGGVGIVGQNLNLTIGASGSVAGGLSGNGVTPANAINFTGGTNSLTLESGAIISGAVAGAGSDALQLDGSTVDSLDTSLFTGFSTLGKSGTSTWTITGSGFTGDTTISNGTLSVDGMIGDAGANTTINGGTLGGSGTVVGTVLVNAGGAIGPGNSIGTLGVTGPVSFAGGSFFDVEVDDAGNSDKVVATGDATLDGGTVRVMAQAGTYNLFTDYTILTANSVSGEFDDVTSDMAFLTPFLSYDATNVYLRLIRNDIVLADVAETPNQRSVVGALDQFDLNDPLYLAVLVQSADGARQAYDALSGEVHATLPGILLNDSRYVRDAILSRLQQASHAGGGASSAVALLGTGGPTVATLGGETMMGLGMGGGGAAAPASGSGLAFWTQGFGAWGDFDGDGNAASADRTTGGFLSGVDAGLGGGWRAGLAAGYSQSDIGVDARLSSADVDSYHLAGYVGGRIAEVALRAGGAWTWHDIDTTRVVVFPGFVDRNEASYGGDTGQLFLEAALPMGMGDTAIEPFAGIAYVHVSTGGFTESGGLAALTAAESDEDVGYSTLGLRAAATMRVDGVEVTPRASVAWQHAFGDVNPDMALAFNANGIGLGISGVPIARDSALIDAGVDVAIAPDATIGVSYLGQLAGDVEDHGIKGRFDWRF